jgi:predicted permease
MIIPMFILRKRNMVSNRVAGDLSTLLLYVTQPLLTIHSFIRPFDMAIVRNILLILLMTFIIHTLFYVISMFMFRRQPENKAKVLRFMVVFSNAGYMCFPILQAMFGSIGVLYGAVYCVGFNLFVWTVGIAIYKKDAGAFSAKNILLNPSTVSVVIAFIIFALSLHRYIPAFAVDTLNVLGSMTSPVSMFVIGVRLADVKWKEFFNDGQMYLATAVRLLVAPMVALGIAKLLGFSGYAVTVPYMACAMPAATATAIFAEKFGGDSVYASKCVVVSTILSIITIPAMIMVINLLG